MNDPLPNFLYRFRSFANEYSEDELSRAVQKREIYLNSAQYQNDPYDCAPSIVDSSLEEIQSACQEIYGHRYFVSKYVLADINQRFKSKKELDAALEQLDSRKGAELNHRIASLLIRDVKNHTRMACLTERKDNGPMWAHYMPKFDGYCIAYKVRRDLFLKFDKLFPLKVNYLEERPIVSTLDFFRFVNESREADNLSVEIKQRIEDVCTALMYTKSESWSYEREWRVTSQTSVAPGYFRCMSLEPCEIIIHQNCSEETARRIFRTINSAIQLKRLVPSALNYSYDEELVAF